MTKKNKKVVLKTKPSTVVNNTISSVFTPPTPPIQEKVNILSNNQFCSIMHTSFFDDKQCDAILNSLIEELWTKGETIKQTNVKTDKKLRQAEQQIMPASSNGWPLTRILEFAHQANNARFKFDLSGFLNIDAPVLMRYKKGGHYDWHIDTGNEVCHRKLSFTIQLSDSKDYEGGDIEFLGTKVEKEKFRQKGTAIIFPSFLPHRITKVTNGVRHAIVGWIHGTTFK